MLAAGLKCSIGFLIPHPPNYVMVILSCVFSEYIYLNFIKKKILIGGKKKALVSIPCDKVLINYRLKVMPFDHIDI